MLDQIPLHVHFENIKNKAQQNGDISLKEILQLMGSDSHYAAIAFLIVPFLQPIPMMGLSTILGIVIAVIAIYSYNSTPPWMPKSWAEKKMPAQSVIKIANFAEKIFKKLSRFVHTRWTFMLGGPFRIINIFLVVVNALLLALPLPIPFTNSVPAWTIFFWALAHLEDDGVFALLSYVGSVLCFAYFTAIALGIDVGIDKLTS